ncbi:MAG: type II secretion system F family protein [Candidatus Diapherotrites archaeon]|uniref:Type II secretion system F family protein n=1 Tax=Candidatus Iainarchaeum sp. TaxID=3101447 RepID=A0A8T4L7C7_9ARCH|nr:type II secretion system F family protein [Candidatus Diapherotrites archaeon]
MDSRIVTRKLETLLVACESPQTAGVFLDRSIREGAAAAAAGVVALWVLQTPMFYITCAGAGLFFLPAFFRFLFLLVESDRRRKQREEMVPDLLLQASVFPPGTPIMKLISYCARSDFGFLGAEFFRAVTEIERGASVESALGAVSRRCKSPSVDRAVHLIVLGYSTGCDLSETFRQTAEDLLETQSILRERSALLWVEKYTILVAGGVVVPVVLGLLSGLSADLDVSAFSTLEIGASSVDRKSLSEMAGIGTWIYLIEYGVLASFFVAIQEGRWKRGVLYAAVLVPLGLAGFWLAAGW